MTNSVIQITRIENTQSRVVGYWYTSKVKDGKLKYNRERIRKSSQTMKLNRNKTRKTKHKEEIKSTNKIKVVKIMKK